MLRIGQQAVLCMPIHTQMSLAAEEEDRNAFVTLIPI